jgi:hypothetical protein
LKFTWICFENILNRGKQKCEGVMKKREKKGNKISEKRKNSENKNVHTVPTSRDSTVIGV